MAACKCQGAASANRSSLDMLSAAIGPSPCHSTIHPAPILSYHLAPATRKEARCLHHSPVPWARGVAPCDEDHKQTPSRFSSPCRTVLLRNALGSRAAAAAAKPPRSSPRPCLVASGPLVTPAPRLVPSPPALISVALSPPRLAWKQRAGGPQKFKSILTLLTCTKVLLRTPHLIRQRLAWERAKAPSPVRLHWT